MSEVPPIDIERGPGDYTEILETVRHNVSQLLSSAARLPSLLRVQAGEVVVQMEWREAKPAVAQPISAYPPSPVAAEPSAEQQDQVLHYLCAPIVGVFYRSAAPGAKPFVAEGDTVQAGQQVAIVEAMKLMIPVEADRAGRIVEVLQPDAAPVEYGDRLFAIAPLDGTN